MTMWLGVQPGVLLVDAVKGAELVRLCPWLDASSDDRCRMQKG